MSFLTSIFEAFKKGQQYDELLSQKQDLEQAISTEKAAFLDQIAKLKIELRTVNEQVALLVQELEQAKFSAEEEFKKYWYNKYPKLTDKRWNGVWLKEYCTTKNNKTQTVSGKDYDETANNALKFVRSFMKYTPDNGEHWQFANESVDRELGDCEDGSILLYNILRKSGVPAWRIRLNAGDVQGQNDKPAGHAWVTYLRESDNTWYILDWCYWYSESVGFRKTWKQAEKYFGIWFSWNEEYVWSEENQGRSNDE